MNKLEVLNYEKFDVVFVGDDWKGTEKWNNYEYLFKKVNVDVVYFPYTKSTSSTQLRELINKKIL